MNNRQTVVNSFIDRILKIERELDELDQLSNQISKSYDTNSFPEQEKLSMDLLENLLIAVTHETASQIGFYRNDIQNLIQFIEFREKHNNLTDEELTEIIDNNLSLYIKKNLSIRFASTKDMLNEINIIKQDWNKLFKNKGYTSIKQSLNIMPK